MKEYYWKGKAISDMDNPTLVLCCNGISHWVNQMGGQLSALPDFSNRTDAVRWILVQADYLQWLSSPAQSEFRVQNHLSRFGEECRQDNSKRSWWRRVLGK